MRKYLLVILTFCYLGCEDTEEYADDVYISSDFIRCGHTYQVDFSLPSNDTIGIVYNIEWNNLVKKQPHPLSINGELIRVDTIFIEYDQYGNEIFSDYTMLTNDSTGISGYTIDSIRYNFTDYWKLIQMIAYYKDGNNTIRNYTWDGLTRFDSDDPSSFSIHNEYGIGVETSWVEAELMNDGKRVKRIAMKNGSVNWTYNWDGYNFELWIDYDDYGNKWSEYFTGTIDEYANIIEEVQYDCDVDPCVPIRKRINEFDCNMFDPIPIE